MAVLGVLLIIIAVLAVGAGLWAGSQPMAAAPKVDFLGGSYTLYPNAMLAIGAGAVVLLFLGLWLMTSAGKRRWRSHRERRDLEKQQREQEKELERTRAELAKRGETPSRDDRRAVRDDAREVRETRRDDVRRDEVRRDDVRRDDVREVREERDLHGHGPRADGTFAEAARDDAGTGMHSGGTLSREEEVRRAAERRREI